jgi:hypothetical protein
MLCGGGSLRVYLAQAQRQSRSDGQSLIPVSS